MAVLGVAVLLAVGGCRDRIVRCDTCPPPRSLYPSIDSETALIENLRKAYQRRDYDKFTTLFSNPTLPPPATQPPYLFILYQPTPGDSSWGYVEEMRIARRMFRPQDVPPGESPVLPEYWLVSVDISFTLQTDFVETMAYYRSPTHPNGLDPARWKATQATYDTYVLFQLAGTTDYQVIGRADFVVIQDLTKTNADVFKWLLYRWKDLGNSHPLGRGNGTLTGQATWSAVKDLYR
jgi:hypothetical protein